MDLNTVQHVYSVDWTIIATSIGSIIAIMGINVALFSWLRTDIKEIKSEAAADRRDILQLIRDVQSEMKDFHGRLCAIEERNRK
jgi:hypothetical protein